MPFLRLFLLAFFAISSFEKAEAQTPDSTVFSKSSGQKSRLGQAARADSTGRKVDDSKNVSNIDSTFLNLKITEKAVDSLPKKARPSVVHFFKKDYPNPRKALLFSLLVPGGGQAYNKKFWKIPLAWAAIGTTGFFMFRTLKTRNAWQRNYLALVDGDPATVVENLPTSGAANALLFSDLDKTSLKQGRDFYRDRLERQYLYVAGAYVLATTDAFVDAHLATFDVSDDLSLRVRPAEILTARGPVVLGLSFAFSIK